MLHPALLSSLRSFRSALRLVLASALVAVLLHAVSAAAQTTAPPDHAPPPVHLAFWFDQAAQAFNEDRLDDWVAATERLHELRPHNQDFMRHLVLGYAQQNRLSHAFNIMLTMQQQGLAEDWDQYDELEPLRQHRLYEHLSDLMRQAGQTFGRFERKVDLPADLVMPEALALDAARQRLFVGSVHDGRIMVRTQDGDWEVFAEPEHTEGLMGVFDLSVDPQRGHLWVATANVTQFSGHDPAAASTALLKLDLETAELLGRYGIPGAQRSHVLGSLVVAGDGTVYTADTAAPLIFRLAPGAQQLEVFFGSQNFSSLRGLALSGDDRLLYVADNEQGIFIVATGDTRQAWQLAVPPSLNVGGIDGLYWWDQHLIVIQNGVSPQRVMRLQLGADGLGVTAVAPVLAALEVFDTPTFGVMQDDRLHLFSGSHWPHVDQRGRPLGEELPAISILTTHVDAAEIMMVGEEALRQLQQQRR